MVPGGWKLTRSPRGGAKAGDCLQGSNVQFLVVANTVPGPVGATARPQASKRLGGFQPCNLSVQGCSALERGCRLPGTCYGPPLKCLQQSSPATSSRLPKSVRTP